jgi:predicted TIM-barrel fold metal-dependent hydrolase
VGEFYSNLSSAPFNKEGIQTDLKAEQQTLFLEFMNEQNGVLHIHDEELGTATESIFKKFPKITFILAHCGYKTPERLRELFTKHKNLYAEMSLVSNRHFGPFRSEPLVTISPSAAWLSLMKEFSSRLLVGSDIGATWDRMSYLGEIISDYRKILGKLPVNDAEKIAHKNFKLLFDQKN